MEIQESFSTNHEHSTENKGKYLRVYAKKRIKFDEDESQILLAKVTKLLKGFEFKVFDNSQGVYLYESKIVKKSNVDDYEIENIKDEMKKKLQKSSKKAFTILQDYLNKNKE